MSLVKDWTTKAGFRAVILFHDELQQHCGYVGVPKEHPLYGVHYMQEAECLTFPSDGVLDKRVSPEDVFVVHGGITYSGGSPDYPVEGHDGLWWFGYDCGHAGDRNRYNAGVFRDEAYCVAECESLAEQMVSRINKEAS